MLFDIKIKIVTLDNTGDDHAESVMALESNVNYSLILYLFQV